MLSTLPPLVFAGEARRCAAPWPRWPRAGPSCSRPATAPSPSPSSPPTPSGTSSRSSCRWPWSSPTAAGCRWSRWAASPGSSPSPARRRTEVDRRAALPVFPRPHGQRRGLRRPRPGGLTPSRLVAAYHQSAATLNLLRAFTKGGFADLSQVHLWNQQFVASSRRGPALRGASPAEIDRALRFMAACGIDLAAEEGLHQVDFFTSHEALILRLRGGPDPRGLAHRRLVRLLGPHCCGAATAPASWTGPTSSSCRGSTTRSAAKVGPSATRRRGGGAVRASSNPDRVPGRLTLISRMGADKVDELLPPLQRAVAAVGPPGRVDVRPDARQHLHVRRRPQDPALRRHPQRDLRRSSRPPRRAAHGPEGSMWSSPATT